MFSHACISPLYGVQEQRLQHFGPLRIVVEVADSYLLRAVYKGSHSASPLSVRSPAIVASVGGATRTDKPHITMYKSNFYIVNAVINSWPSNEYSIKNENVYTVLFILQIRETEDTRERKIKYSLLWPSGQRAQFLFCVDSVVSVCPPVCCSHVCDSLGIER